MSGLDLDAIDATHAALERGMSVFHEDSLRRLCDVVNAWPAASAEIRRLRSDLAAARAEADALRGLVGEACDGWEDQAAMSTDGPASIRARAEKAGGR